MNGWMNMMMRRKEERGLLRENIDDRILAVISVTIGLPLNMQSKGKEDENEGKNLEIRLCGNEAMRKWRNRSERGRERE